VSYISAVRFPFLGPVINPFTNQIENADDKQNPSGSISKYKTKVNSCAFRYG
jgi:hypothetical protein